MKLLEEIIKTFPSMLPTEHYENETAMNPTYQSLEDSCLLRHNKKKIWVLRTDLIIGIGSKNFDFMNHMGKDELSNEVEEKTQQYINLLNRAGHPTLAIPEGDYDGSVYLAGWLCLRAHGKIEVLLQSGRFHHDTPLTPTQRNHLELYIARRLMNTYGNHDVVFYDFNKYISEDYFNDKIIKKSLVRKDRTYTPAQVQKLNNEEAYIMDRRKKEEMAKTTQSLHSVAESKNDHPVKKKINDPEAAAIIIQRFFRSHKLRKNAFLPNQNPSSRPNKII